MAKTKEKIAKKKEPLEVKTPYPKKEEKKTSDVDFIGGELVKLSNRLNEAELSISDLQIKLNQARVRLGLE